MNGILNKENLKKAHEKTLHDDYNPSFNCWGGTLYALGEVEALEWSSLRKITDFLEEKTFIIEEDDLQEGDILALFFDSGEITHTAVYLGNGCFWHKIGNSKSEYTDKDGVFSMYSDFNDFHEFRRVKNI